MNFALMASLQRWESKMMKLKSFAGQSLPASLLLLAACTGGGGLDQGNGGPGGGHRIATVPQLTNGGTIMQFGADAQGAVMTVFGQSDVVVAVSPSGTVTTLYTPPSQEYVLEVAPAGDQVYFNALEIQQGTSTLYAVPRTGGPATSVYVNADSSRVPGALAIGDSSIYLTYNTHGSGTSGGATAPATIVQIDKSSGQASVIYSSPAGQDIDFLSLDGSSLYWCESDSSRDEGATLIRSAALGAATLNASVVATIASPSDVTALVETNGTMVGASLVTSSGGDAGISVGLPFDGGALRISAGVFSVTSGASEATAVANYGTSPIAVNPGVVYYNYGTGIAKSQVSASSVGAPIAVSTGFAPQMAGDGHGGVYYTQLNQDGLYKL